MGGLFDYDSKLFQLLLRVSDLPQRTARKTVFPLQ